MFLTIILLAMALAMALYGSTYRKSGDVLDHYSAGALAVDAVIQDAGRLGVVSKAIGAAGTDSVSFRGVHDLPALSTDAWKKGDMLWWDPSALVLTRLGLPTLWPAGIAAADKAATTGVRAWVDINNWGQWPSGWWNKTVIDPAADLTLTAADHSGGIVMQTVAAKTITLPVGVVGMEFIIVNSCADAVAGAGLVTVDLNGNEIIAGANLTIAATKTALNTLATSRRGDFLHLICNVAATSWRCVGRRGTWVTS